MSKNASMAEDRRRYNNEMALKRAELNNSYNTNVYNNTTKSASTKSASTTGTEERKSAMTNSNILKTAMAYAQQGVGNGSAYYNYLENLFSQGYDTNEIEDYVEANTPKQISVEKNGLGRKDNKYTDQWGNVYDYATRKRRQQDHKTKNINKVLGHKA